MRSPADHEIHADDDTTDLSQPPEEAADDDRAQRAPRQGRRLWAAPAAVGLGLGSALAATGAHWHHSATPESERITTTTALGDLHLGKLRNADHDGTTTGGHSDDQSREVVSVWLTVRNEGSRAVTADAEGISGNYAQLVGAPSSSTIDPGASAVLTLNLAVDCSAVPGSADGLVNTETGLDDSGNPSLESWVALRVTREGADSSTSRAWRYDTLPIPAYSLPAVLAKFCSAN